MSHTISQELSGCFGFAGGLDKRYYQQQLERLTPVLSGIKARSCPLTSALLDLPTQSDDLEAITNTARRIHKQFDHVVVCGSGGSGLGARMFAQFHTPAIDLHVLENIDPDALQRIMAAIDITRTAFIFISKSGTTVETLSQFFVLREAVQQAGGSLAKQFIVITMQQDSPLLQAARDDSIPWLEHPANIGGRFSALTCVGLLPAALCGLDVAALRKGAASVVQALDACDAAAQCPPAQAAALHAAAMHAGKPIYVIWPYGERLAGYAAWMRQSWAESLGKSGKGSTPLVAMGSTDQHSQLQLFLDGPKDKLFHVLTTGRSGRGPIIPGPESLPYLAGHTLGDVMQAQQDATMAALIEQGCPVWHTQLEKLDEEHFGALLMQGMLEIILMAALLEVNPFDQPAVEASKQIARSNLQQGAA